MGCRAGFGAAAARVLVGSGERGAREINIMGPRDGAGLRWTNLICGWTRLPRGDQLDTVGRSEVETGVDFLKLCMFSLREILKL